MRQSTRSWWSRKLHYLLYIIYPIPPPHPRFVSSRTNSNTKISAPLRLRGKTHSIVIVFAPVKVTGARVVRIARVAAHAWLASSCLSALVAILNSSLRGNEWKWGGLPKQSPDWGDTIYPPIPTQSHLKGTLSLHIPSSSPHKPIQAQKPLRLCVFAVKLIPLS